MEDPGNPQKQGSGCWIAVWVVSPLVALLVYGFARMVLFIDWGIREDLSPRYQSSGEPSWSAWWSDYLKGWWELRGGRWVAIAGLALFVILVPLYTWAIATARRRRAREERN